MKSDTDWKVPFATESNRWARAGQHIYATDEQWGTREGDIEYRENVPFDDTLVITQSPAARLMRYIAKSEITGDTYVIFTSDMLEIMQKVGIGKGARITARFSFVKRGTRIGLRLCNAYRE